MKRRFKSLQSMPYSSLSALTQKSSSFVVFLVGFSLISSCLAVCSVTSPPGSCTGPQERSQAINADLDVTNGGCALGKVSYYRDDDTSKVLCGECVPGKGGWDDPSHLCELDEYCTDGGKCAPLIKSPFYKKECPYETGSLPSFCGAGLRCYHHECLPCLNGMVDYTDGKICVQNQWTYSRWLALAYSPSDTFALLIFIFLILAVLTPLAYRAWRKFGRQRFYRALNYVRRKSNDKKSDSKGTGNVDGSDMDSDGDLSDSDSNGTNSPARKS